jgi:hypothetical protein
LYGSSPLEDFARVPVLIGPLAGVFVDRWNRRGVMLRTEVFRAILVGLLAVVSFVLPREETDQAGQAEQPGQADPVPA